MLSSLSRMWSHWKDNGRLSYSVDVLHMCKHPVPLGQGCYGYKLFSNQHVCLLFLLDSLLLLFKIIRVLQRFQWSSRNMLITIVVTHSIRCVLSSISVHMLSFSKATQPIRLHFFNADFSYHKNTKLVFGSVYLCDCLKNRAFLVTPYY